ncbi:GNAT family N-acetyltransferase [Clostridium sp. HBUAS56010]|uniref:GNAT family N-acetyltransferase n=1 Tax=Clostridium sp. HBUAS56010 TaxID=2571127 RepID=UPI00117866AB|nr:GNAT family N-acetyltransferase [Clostridium sp. HBUAS56010]
MLEDKNHGSKSRLYLVQPTEEYKDKILNFKKEFFESGDTLYGTENLQHMSSFEEWLLKVYNNRYEETVEPGKAPSYEFMAIREWDRTLIGMINLRYNLKKEMYLYYGNIGYCVRKTERRKGYAAEMLRLTLLEAKTIGLNQVLLTVDNDNQASISTMKKNGAILENEVPYNGKITQRYWIKCE